MLFVFFTTSNLLAFFWSIILSWYVKRKIDREQQQNLNSMNRIFFSLHFCRCHVKQQRSQLEMVNVNSKTIEIINKIQIDMFLYGVNSLPIFIVDNTDMCTLTTPTPTIIITNHNSRIFDLVYRFTWCSMGIYLHSCGKRLILCLRFVCLSEILWKFQVSLLLYYFVCSNSRNMCIFMTWHHENITTSDAKPEKNEMKLIFSPVFFFLSLFSGLFFFFFFFFYAFYHQIFFSCTSVFFSK